MERLEDPAGEPDYAAVRYGRALRMALVPVAVGTTIVGVLFALLLGGATTSVETRIVIEQPSAVLTQLNLVDTFGNVPSMIAAIDRINSSDERDEVPADTVDAEVDPATGQSILVTVFGADEDQASERTSAVLASLEEWIGEERSSAVADLAEVLSAQLDLRSARLGELDEEINQLPDSAALRDAFLDERGELNNAIVDLEAGELALASFVASTERLRIVDSSPTSSDTRIILFISGMVVGAILLVGVTLVWAHFDRRVRSRGDLLGLVDGALAPAMPSSGPEVASAREAVFAQLHRNGRHVKLIPVDTEGTAAAQAFAEGAEDLGVADPMSLPAIDQQVVIVAVAGVSSVDDVARLAQYLESAGHVDIDALLIGVSPKRLRQAAL